MRWSEGFIAVDWGTTNRRAYRIDREGSCVSSFEDGRGILSVHPGEFASAAQELRHHLGNLPLLLAGMVGSSRGWVEAPYVGCPADIDDLAAQITWIEPSQIAVLPGVSVMDEDRADVMRGEEIQIFGAIAGGAIPESCFVGHPGTHNKWVVVRHGQVVNFRTVMTGEMFGMLRDRGTLAEMLTEEVFPDEAFRKGVRKGLLSPVLTAELFSVRAAVLLGRMTKTFSQSYVSGLLIGADLSVGLRFVGSEPIILMGDPELTGLYAAAAGVAGRKTSQVNGEGAFLAGATAIGRMLA